MGLLIHVTLQTVPGRVAIDVRSQFDGKDVFILTHVAQLPTYLVAEITGNPDNAVINVRNALYQATAGARLLFSEIHDHEIK